MFTFPASGDQSCCGSSWTVDEVCAFPLVTTANKGPMASHMDYWANPSSNTNGFFYDCFQISVFSKTSDLCPWGETSCFLSRGACARWAVHLWSVVPMCNVPMLHVCAFFSADTTLLRFCPLGGPSCVPECCQTLMARNVNSCWPSLGVFTNTSIIGEADVLPFFHLFLICCVSSLCFRSTCNCLSVGAIANIRSDNCFDFLRLFRTPFFKYFRLNRTLFVRRSKH